MIYIEERVSKSVVGETSLFVSFNYDEKLINIIKSVADGAAWNSKQKEWEIPISNLSKILDNFTYFDDINIKLLASKNAAGALKETTLSYKIKPFSYQLDAIKYGLNHNKWLLLDSPGLGKSAEIIHIAEELKAQEGLQHCLVICGVNTLKTNWKREVLKHSNLSAMILGEKVNSKGTVTWASVNERAEQLKNKIDEFFIITNIESWRSSDMLEAFRNSNNAIDMIVFDECHRAKDPGSQSSKHLLKLTSKYKIAATGTLLLNSPLDAYVPLKWIEKERATFTNFKSYFCNYGGTFHNEIISYKNMEELKETINSCSLRRTKDILDLPEKTIIKEFVDMNPDQERFYEDVKNGVKRDVDKIELNTSSLFSLVTRLRQATACPSILTTTNIKSSKIERACELAEEIINNGDKVVIFSCFKETANQIHEKLKCFNSLLCTGDVDDDIINKNIDLFQNKDINKVMVCTISKMGTGLTMTAANYAIFIDQPWTSGLQEQAEDRIHRIGSKKPVFIYRLISNNTIDERVDQIVDSKEAIADYMIDGVASEKQFELLRKIINEL